MTLREEGFWDDFYGNELKNYEETGDEGEVWLGKGLTRAIITWLIKKLSNTYKVPVIIDVGCGNSFLISELITRYRADLGKPRNSSDISIVGLDYSLKAIELSKKILSGKGLDKLVSLHQCDILNYHQVETIVEKTKGDYIIDVGTFDAVCLLASQSEEELERARTAYLRSIDLLAHDQSVFIIASCNHTEPELLSILSRNPQKSRWTLVDKIEQPKIMFGGKEGSLVTCLILEQGMRHCDPLCVRSCSHFDTRS